MRKIVWLVVLLCLGVSGFAQTGVIRELSGTVEIREPGALEFVRASAGDLISQDTILSTGFNSFALIEVQSALITVRPLTRLSLTEISAAAGTETINANLQTGRVRVDLNPPAGVRASMRVSSPSAVASVRGTSFEFDTRFISVRQGGVNFQGNRGHIISVYAGFVSGLAPDGTARDAVFTGVGRVQEAIYIPASVIIYGDIITPQGVVGSESDSRTRAPGIIPLPVERQPDPPPPPPPPPGGGGGGGSGGGGGAGGGGGTAGGDITIGIQW